MEHISEATRLFIHEHRTEDVRQLALQASRSADINLSFALDQIAGWQTARTKLPSWAATDRIIYPPHLSMEQCSSELTARYKEKVIAANLPLHRETVLSANHPRVFIDLTGGFGVDFSFMSRSFDQRIYVEREEHLCEIAHHNFSCLNLDATIKNDESTAFLHAISQAECIFLDPARRNEHGGRTYGIADCTPNVLEMWEELLSKAELVLLKLSPMLDWRKVVKDLREADKRGTQSWYLEIHIVSVDNECKELLVVCKEGVKEVKEEVKLVCINLFSKGGEERFEVIPHPSALSLQPSSLSLQPSAIIPQPSQGRLEGFSYLYEPNASVMKAGCFDELAKRFGVHPLAQNSHLFVANHSCADFPGRHFEIVRCSSMNKKELGRSLTDITCANITVRNFPMTVAALRKRLKLKDGGDIYIFATTLAQGEHVLIIAKKIK